MLKLIGAFFILFSALQLGLLKSRRLHQRVQCLEQLKGLLNQFLGEVQFGLRPLPDIFERLGNQPGGEGFALTAQEMKLRDGRSAGNCFYSAIEASYPLLSQEDKETLLALGEGLGACDNATQCRLIESVIRQLEVRQQSAREFAVKNGRLYQGLGLTGGLFFILLLI